MPPRRNNSAIVCTAMIALGAILWCQGCSMPMPFIGLNLTDDSSNPAASTNKNAPTARAQAGADVSAPPPVPAVVPPAATMQPYAAAYPGAPYTGTPNYTGTPYANTPYAGTPYSGTAANATMSPPSIPSPNGAAADPRELTALIEEVQSLGALDPEAQRGLLNDLKQCDPKLWPQLVRQFKTALAYRRQMASAAQQTGPESGVSAMVLNTALARMAANASAPRELPSEPAKQIPPIAAPQNSTSAVQPSALRNADSVRLASAASAIVDKPKHEKSERDKVASEPAKPKPAAESSLNITSNASASDGWKTRLRGAILELESQGAGAGTTPTDVDRQINLRLLYLAAGRRDDAMRPISGLSPEEQQFWSKELFGLSTILDSTREASAERRATEAALHLRDAAAQLGDLATPVVRNLAFCKEVTSFGVYKKFPSYEFSAGDEALLYCELENLKAVSSERGYHTAVKGSYQLLDAHGSRIAEQEFNVSDDFCADQRRDFFIVYHILIPKQIAIGSYTLQLTIEDAQSQKIGQSTVQFKVK